MVGELELEGVRAPEQFDATHALAGGGGDELEKTLKAGRVACERRVECHPIAIQALVDHEAECEGNRPPGESHRHVTNHALIGERPERRAVEAGARGGGEARAVSTSLPAQRMELERLLELYLELGPGTGTRELDRPAVLELLQSTPGSASPFRGHLRR